MTITRPSRVWFTCVSSILFAAAISAPAFAQDARPTNTDLKFHKFVPPTPPENNASASAARQATTPDAVNSAATQQMQLLLQEKSSRTPAQQKIDSNILYTIRMMSGQPAAPGFQSLYTGVDLDDTNRIVVDIVANVTPELLQQLQTTGALVMDSHPEYRAFRAIVPANQIETIAALPDVSFIGRRAGYLKAGITRTPSNFLSPLPASSSSFDRRAENVRRQLSALLQTQHARANTTGVINTGQGSVTTEGDATHLAAQARGVFGVNGSGLKIGVLSDSANSTGAARAAQATGDLPPTCPGTGGPCLTILQDSFGGDAIDEGTAMMEIIYDMAPGASLFFATSDISEAGFASNILALQAAGCNIILDDTGYFDEPVFQDGVVAQSVNTVTAAGVLYFSAAGNEGHLSVGSSGYFEGDFNDAGSPAFTFPGGTKSGTINNFHNNLIGDLVDASGEAYTLEWSDSYGSSANDYDLFYTNISGIVIASSTNIQSGTQNPFEQIAPPTFNNGDMLVVFKSSSASPRFFALNTLRGQMSTVTTGQTHGHSAAVAAFSVAAIPAAGEFELGDPGGPYPGPFTVFNNLVERFSSDGPRRVFYNSDGSQITPGNLSSTGGTVRSKPDLTAADGVSTTLPANSGLNPFYGTSAATPHAAAIAALLLSADPSLTPAQVRNTLTSTAIDIEAPGVDVNSGSGTVMAFAALNSLGLNSFADPEIASVAASENPGNGNGLLEAGEGGIISIQLKNTSGAQAATNITAVLTTLTPGVTITMPGITMFPDLSAGAGPVPNLAPLTFTLSTGLQCGLTLEFSLTLTYNGGPTKTLNFSVPAGIITISSSLASGTPTGLPQGITYTSGMQTGRVFRALPSSNCGQPKAFPGFGATTGSRYFDEYTFTAGSTACLTVPFNSPNGDSLFEVAYTPNLNPANVSTNYLGDATASSASQSVSFSTVAGITYSIVVSDVNLVGVGSSQGAPYTIQIPTCILTNDATINHPPIARAHDVSVIADTIGGTANASIDFGSSDPDAGDTITLTQTPPGPYPVGTTSVLLTVVDSKGATAQATANVSILNPVTDLAITKSHTGNFTRGQIGATYTIAVINLAAPGTSAPVTVVDSLPPGLTATSMSGFAWGCTLATLTCTRSDILDSGITSWVITLTVNVAPDAPLTVTNIATVSGGGDANPANNVASDVTTIVSGVPDLTVVGSHSGNFAEGQIGAEYSIIVTNSSSAFTTAPVTVVDSLPAVFQTTSMTGSGWLCILPTRTCTRSDVLGPQAIYPPINLIVNVPSNAPTSVMNTVTVSGGGETNTSNDTSIDPTSVVALPDMTVTMSHVGNFQQGQSSANYTVIVSNSGLGPTTLPVNLIAGATFTSSITGIAGSGWSCTLASATCDRSDVLAAGSSYPPVTLTLNVPNSTGSANAGTATVSGGGETNTSNDNANDPTTILATPDLFIASAHSGNFTQGQNGAIYSISVTNLATTPTTASATVVDTVPAGLTATGISGTGWSCTLASLTCVRSDLLAAGNSYPTITLTVNVAPNAPASLTNVAVVSGGGELNTSNDTASDVTVIISSTPADMMLTKSHIGDFAQGQVGGVYTITATNNGTGPTSGTVTVVDTPPQGLTVTAISGSGWTCSLNGLTCSRNDVLANGSSYPPITVTVNVGINAPALETNIAIVSGGGEAVTNNDAAKDPTNVTQFPDLTVAINHAGNFEQGQTGATYTLTPTNGGQVPTSGTVTVVDTLPPALTATAISGPGWMCNLATLTCTRADVLAALTSYSPITLTVNVASNAPALVTNTATISGGGELNTNNDTSGDQTTITGAPDLTVTSTHVGNFSQGQTFVPYSIVVTNVGTAPTTGTVTIVDTLPLSLTAVGIGNTGWNCVFGPPVSCTRSDALAPGASYPTIIVEVNVATNAPPTVTNIVTVSGGGEFNAANDIGTDPTIITLPPDLTIVSTHSGNFFQGENLATYTLTVANSGGGSTTGTVTVADMLPVGMTIGSMSGPGWTCAVPTTVCTRSDVLTSGSTYPPISLAVNLAPNTAATVTNTATVYGGAEINKTNDASTDPTTVTQLPDMTVSLSHVGNFQQGQIGAAFTSIVTNSGSAPTTAPVNVVITSSVNSVPVSLSGGGWNCTLATQTCTRSDVLAAGASYPAVTFTINVIPGAALTGFGSANVSGGGEADLVNDIGFDNVIITPAPDLAISKTHVGNFTQGQTAAKYTIVVQNAGSAATSGTVTVVDSLPPALTATAISGSGWVCLMASLTCTRNDSLGSNSQFPAITVTVNVAANSPSSVTNTAAVSGGGELNAANDAASDVTLITVLPDLTITKSHVGTFTQGQQSGPSYTIIVTNSGAGPTAGTVTVVDTLPAALTATGIAGSGWSCTLATATCTRADVLAASASYPAITVTVSVANNAPASVTNTVTVSGGGEVNTTNDTASDATTITQLPDMTISAFTAPPGSFLKGQTGAQFSFTATNSGAGSTSAPVTVTATLPAALTPTAIAGTGWTCTLGTLTCTRADVLQAGQSYPSILFTMNVDPNAPTSVSTAATVSGGGEVVTTNDSVTFSTTITAPPSVTLSALSLSFPNQGVNTTSAARQITVTNNGGQTLTFLGIAATLLSNTTNWAIAPGTTCANGVSVAGGGGQCVINITFTPTAVGSVGPDSLTLNDNATPSAQNITLTGTGIDFSATGPASPVTITAGQTANFTISLTPGAGGFANAVTFSATGLPAASSASFSPSSLTPGGTATSTMLSISTTARGILPPVTKPNPRTPQQLILWLLALISTTLTLFAFARRRPARQRRFAPAMLVAIVVLTATVIAGCGGGGVTAPPPPTGTPAGTSIITVTAQSGTLVHTTNVTLTVQ
jgi:uncharacterized repeat protein (TIGR01451 family)